MALKFQIMQDIQRISLDMSMIKFIGEQIYLSDVIEACRARLMKLNQIGFSSGKYVVPKYGSSSTEGTNYATQKKVKVKT